MMTELIIYTRTLYCAYLMCLIIDTIPLLGLEMKIAVTGICVSPDRNNGMLAMYYNVREVHECVAYLSKMTKKIIGAYNKRYYVSPHQTLGWSFG